MFYAAATDGGHGPQIDISSSVRAQAVSASDSSLELVKTLDPLTDWTFDIIITSFGIPKPSLPAEW